MKKSAKKSKLPARRRKGATNIPAKRAKSLAPQIQGKKPPVRASVFPKELALYVYGVTEIPSKPFAVTAEAVDGHGQVEPIAEGNYLCWISRVSRHEFADELQQNMDNLEWLAACSIRHQKVLSEIGATTAVLPARFGTVFLSPDTLIADFKQKIPKLREVFRRIADADEWGVKIFGTPQTRSKAAVSATSGVDYLRQKSAALQAASAARHDEAAEKFGEDLSKVSEASVAGGKASNGQPGLLWSASFLVKRAKKKRFDETLKRYAAEWGATRRIDVSGPWPPYSFISEGQ
jgi:Gas vesicle synthesis protein GvpL/GvpF